MYFDRISYCKSSFIKCYIKKYIVREIKCLLILIIMDCYILNFIYKYYFGINKYIFVFKKIYL